MQGRNALIVSALRRATSPFRGSRAVELVGDPALRTVAEVVKPAALASTRISRLTGPHAFQRIDGGCAVPRISGGHATATLLERF